MKNPGYVFLCVLMLWISSVIAANTAGQKGYNDVYVIHGDLFRQFFREPFESIVIIFKDGEYYVFTTHEDQKVSFPANYIVEFLKDEGKKVEDIAIIIHNHDRPAPFSWGNNNFYKYLKNKGFKGFFSIYYSYDGSVKIKKNNGFKQNTENCR